MSWWWTIDLNLTLSIPHEWQSIRPWVSKRIRCFIPLSQQNISLHRNFSINFIQSQWSFKFNWLASLTILADTSLSASLTTSTVTTMISFNSVVCCNFQVIYQGFLTKLVIVVRFTWLSSVSSSRSNIRIVCHYGKFIWWVHWIVYSLSLTRSLTFPQQIFYFFVVLWYLSLKLPYLTQLLFIGCFELIHAFFLLNY